MNNSIFIVKTKNKLRQNGNDFMQLSAMTLDTKEGHQLE